MSEPQAEFKTTDLSLNGLEEVFDVDSTVIAEFDHGAKESIRSRAGEGLTIREASQHYGIAIPTVRIKIKTGDIPAIKVNGPKGPEWRVFPHGLPNDEKHGDISQAADHLKSDSSLNEVFQQTDRTVAEGFQQANINVASLIKANQELISKLEALTFRNGYLEAQTEGYKEQVKLLTDSQHRRGTWSRFWSWFTGH